MIPTIKPSFAAGELSPFLHGRIDLARFHTGARRLKNFFVHPHGGASNRPGTRFVGPVDDHAVRHRLIPFQFRTAPAGQTYVLVFGHRTLQVMTNGGLVLDGGGVYTLATPYDAADLARLKYVQSADTMTLTHPAHPPRALTRTGHAAWSLGVMTFAPQTAAPSGLAAAAGGSAGFIQVTAINDNTGEESLPASGVGASSATAGSWSWNAVPGCSAYNVYKRKGSVYGFVAQVAATSWSDAAIDPDIGSTPPQARNPFATGFATGVTIVSAGSGYSAPTGVLYDGGVALTPVSIGVDGSGAIASAALANASLRASSSAYITISDGAGGGAVLSIDWDAPVYNTLTGYYESGIGGISVLAGGAGYHAGVQVILYEAGVPTAPYYAFTVSLGGGAIASVAASGTARFNVDVLHAFTIGVVDSTGSGGVLIPSLTPDTTSYPQCSTYYQQRQVFAATQAKPQTLWFSGVGAFNNMAVSQPTRDSDAITRALTGRQVNEIRHLVTAGSSLLVMTSGAEWRCWPGPSAAALTPSSCSTVPQTAYGSSHVPPVETGNALLFIQERGSRVRELRFDVLQEQYQAADMSVLASHLFGDSGPSDSGGQHTIEEWAFAEEPFRIVWAVRSDGTLLGFTYMREHEVHAWHVHETDGIVESVACIAENGADAVYLIVRRTVDGQTKRYLERLAERRFATPADAWFVDCGLAYSGTPVSSVSGLGHLEGRTVAILGDGSVMAPRVVNGGTVALDQPCSKVIVGLPYEAELETLNLELPAGVGSGGGTVQGRMKKIGRVTVRVKDSRGLEIGVDPGALQEVKQRGVEPLGAALSPFTGDWAVTVPGEWNREGRIMVRQRWPLPCTVLDLIAEVVPGG